LACATLITEFPSAPDPEGNQYESVFLPVEPFNHKIRLHDDAGNHPMEIFTSKNKSSKSREKYHGQVLQYECDILSGTVLPLMTDTTTKGFLFPPTTRRNVDLEYDIFALS